MDGGGTEAAPIIGRLCLVACPGQGRDRAAAVDDGHPPVSRLDPLIPPHTAHIALVGEAVFVGQVGQDITINVRSLHLPEAAGDTAEQEGDLGHILVGGQPKCRR